MDSSTPSNDTKTLARRRLLRGSFSVPAVLTLASGSALADKSATCLAKATKTSSTMPLATGTPSDTFIRVKLIAYTNGSTSGHAVTRASFSGMPVSTSFWNTGTAWQGFDTSTNELIGGQQTGSIPGTSSTSNYWVALRFNAAGEIVGVGKSGSGSVVGQSCWNSIKTSP